MKAYKTAPQLAGWLASAGLLLAGPAGAEVVTFQNMGIAEYGEANISVPTSTPYTENGVVVGVVDDPTDPTNTAHLHQQGAFVDFEAQYHPDSSGVYIRKADGSAFSLSSFKWQSVAAIGQTTPLSGNIVVYGYANAFNTLLNTSSVPDYGLVTPIATYTMANVFSPVGGEFTASGFPAAFSNVKSVWIHFQGYPHVPGKGTNPTPPLATPWDIRIDDITLGATPGSKQVPLPPFALWALGAALAFLSSQTRRNSKVAV